MVAHAPERVMGGHPGVRDLSHEELEARVREVISAPRLLVHGGGDTAVPPEHSHRAVAAIPGATLEVLDGGTHLALRTHPDPTGRRAARRTCCARRPAAGECRIGGILPGPSPAPLARAAACA